jgi:hypothetical protein
VAGGGAVRRLLGILSILGAIVWGGMFGWSGNSPETETRVRVRTAAFCVMGAAMLMPAARRKEGQPPEEETF